MSRIISVLLLASFALILASSAEAVEKVSYNWSLGNTNTDWTRNSYLPLFDPSQGTLVRVEINATMYMVQNVSFEHMNSTSPATITVDTTGDLNVTLLDGSKLHVLVGNTTVTDVTEFDGVYDFAGTSGFNYTFSGNNMKRISIILQLAFFGRLYLNVFNSNVLFSPVLFLYRSIFCYFCL